jgi:type I restriction enzyme S subunit
MSKEIPLGYAVARGLPPKEKIYWDLRRSDELFKLIYGKALVAASRQDGNIPVYGTNGQCGWHSVPSFQGPGIIIGRKGQGPLGVEYCPTDYWVIDTAYSLKLVEGLSIKYCYYLIDYVGLNHLKDGTSNPTLSRDSFGHQLFPLPPAEDQKAIAFILGTLDEKIELNRKTNETLEAIAKALFKSWFVDFDPVRAKVESRPTGLPAEISDLFPDSFEDSELGEIPSGWRVAPVGDVVECVGGSTPSTNEPEYWDGGEYFWATPKDLSSLSEPFLLDTAKKITADGVQRISSGILPVGTVLLSSRAPVGYVAAACVPVSINQGFIALKSNGLMSSAYLLNWCLSNVQQFKDRASGTTFAEISKAAFRPIPLLVPSEQVARSFSDKAQALYERVVSNMRQSTLLAATRDSLLPKLISGEIRIPDAEKMLEEVGV